MRNELKMEKTLDEYVFGDDGHMEIFPTTSMGGKYVVYGHDNQIKFRIGTQRLQIMTEDMMELIVKDFQERGYGKKTFDDMREPIYYFLNHRLRNLGEFHTQIPPRWGPECQYVLGGGTYLISAGNLYYGSYSKIFDAAPDTLVKRCLEKSDLMPVKIGGSYGPESEEDLVAYISERRGLGKNED
jgi:hypothetical protein